MSETRNRTLKVAFVAAVALIAGVVGYRGASDNETNRAIADPLLASATDCWDEYTLSGNTVQRIVTPSAVNTAACTAPTYCMSGLSASSIRNRVYVPHGQPKSYCNPPPPTTTTTSTTTTVVPTSTSTSTTIPATTTTVAPTTTTTTLPGGSTSFVADFATSSDFYDRFDREVHFRANDYDHAATFHGDHNEACAGPTTGRTIHLDSSVNAEVFYWCAPAGPDTGHVMDAMGPAGFGYSIVTFKPKESFTGVDKICINVNNTDLGGDNWWEMSIIPKATYDANAPRLDYVTALARDIDDTALSFPSSSFVFQVNDNKIRAYQGMNELVFDWFQWSTTDRATRFQHCMTDNHDGFITLSRQVGATSSEAPGGVRTLTVRGSFPQGPAVVLFQHSIYDPPKHGSGPTQTTFHWDHVLINS